MRARWGCARRSAHAKLVNVKKKKWWIARFIVSLMEVTSISIIKTTLTLTQTSKSILRYIYLYRNCTCGQSPPIFHPHRCRAIAKFRWSQNFPLLLISFHAGNLFSRKRDNNMKTLFWQQTNSKQYNPHERKNDALRIAIDNNNIVRRTGWRGFLSHEWISWYFVFVHPIGDTYCIYGVIYGWADIARDPVVRRNSEYVLEGGNWRHGRWMAALPFDIVACKRTLDAKHITHTHR